jgi:hypothetical protein
MEWLQVAEVQGPVVGLVNTITNPRVQYNGREVS